MSLSEVDLRSVLAGDAAATEHFVSELRALASKISGGRYRLFDEDAQDVLAQVLLKLWENDREALRRWRNECSLETYLSVVVHRQCLMRLRGQRRSPIAQAEVDPDSIASEPVRDLVERQQEWHTCRDALARLSRRDREIIELRYLEDLEYEQIVARLGITPGAARKALHAALGRLRAKMKKHGHG